MSERTKAEIWSDWRCKKKGVAMEARLKQDFDPENVDEFVAERDPFDVVQCVYRRDYMKLLELYRAQLADASKAAEELARVREELVMETHQFETYKEVATQTAHDLGLGMNENGEWFNHAAVILHEDMAALREGIATLKSDKERHARHILDISIALDVPVGMNAVQYGTQLRAELARERERHQELRKIVKEYRESWAGKHDFCGDIGDIVHPPCATCQDANALLEPKAEPASAAQGDWKSGEQQPRFVMTGGSLWDNQEQCFWKRIESDE